jgi:ribosomal protein S18 acetylase RimI-like enzyme
MGLGRLSSRSDLVQVAPDDAFVRYAVPADLPAPAYALDGALAITHPTTRAGMALTLLGTASAIDTLLASLIETRKCPVTTVDYLTMPRAALATVQARVDLGRGGDWEWLSTSSAPGPVPGDERLIALGPDDLAEVRAFLAVENPRTDARPGERHNEHWVGVRDGSGALLACGVGEDGSGGYPELAGITVRSDHRGSGLGAAVTARLTREAVAAVGVCTLGMYADNATARRLYHRLGYATAHSFATRVPQW